MIERKFTVNRGHQLPVQHEGPRREPPQGLGNLGKRAGERLAGLRLKLHAVAIFESEASEAIPFRFVLPVGALQQNNSYGRLRRRKGGFRRKAIRERGKDSTDPQILERMVGMGSCSAQEAGVTEKLWSVGDIVKLLG